jgi:hypothetical protein
MCDQAISQFQILIAFDDVNRVGDVDWLMEVCGV